MHLSCDDVSCTYRPQTEVAEWNSELFTFSLEQVATWPYFCLVQPDEFFTSLPTCSK